MTIDFADSPNLIVNQSAAASFVSPVCSLKIMNDCSFHFNWTGTFTGILKITTVNSQDIVDPINPPPNLIWDPLLTYQVTNGQSPANDQNWIAELETSAKYVRAEYQFTSGTGTINCAFFSKSEG